MPSVSPDVAHGVAPVSGRRAARAGAAPERRAPAPLRAVAQALVIAVVVAGTSAFAMLHKSVTVEVDGETTTVSAFGRTVEDVLAAADITVGEHDVVVPGLDEAIATHGEIVVSRGREVAIEVDGELRTVWTTAQTVGDILAELGMRSVRSSASRSAALDDGLLRLSTPKTVHVTVDGVTTDLGTSALTVREALLEAGVVLGELDEVSVPLDAAAVDGLVVMVTRVTTVVLSETTELAFGTVREDDPDLAVGTEKVAVAGANGTHVLTYESHQVDGVEIGRTMIAERILTAPVDQVVRVGTKTAPAVPAVAPVEPGTSRAIGLELTLARGWSADEFACLDALWTKESGWRVDAANRSSGAYGIPQALPGSKMASAGADWASNPATQITWGLGYVAGRYGTPCGAWAAFLSKGWY